MKKLFILVLCTIFFFSAQAQLTKGNWLVSGAGSLYSYNETYISPSANFSAKYTNVDISTSVGYFPIDKLSAGLRPTFSSNKGEVINGGKTNSYQLAIGPFVKYYFLKADKPFNLLTDVSYQFGFNQYLGVLHEKGKFNTFSIKGGAVLFFNTAVGMEILIGYKHKVVSIDDSPGVFQDITKGLQTSVGFQIHLEKF